MRHIRWNDVARLCITTGMVLTLSAFARADVLLQSDSHARFGDKDFAYFFIEAEDFHDNNPRGDGESWLLTSDPDAEAIIINDVDEDPDTGELVEPDPWAFASGDESITNVLVNSTVTNEVGGQHDIQYLVQFDTAGTYYLYMRHHSPVGPELNRNQNDSFYYPIEFGEDPTQLKANGDDYGLLESMEYPGDTARRGPWVWFAAREFVENLEQDPPIDQDPTTFLEYDITPAMVGEELVLEFDHRETGTMLDAFLFIETSSGLPPTNGEGPDGNGFFGVGDLVDLEFGLANLGQEAPVGDQLFAGDADQDFDFDQLDLVKVQIAAKYLTGLAATWGEGDWDGAPGGSPGSPPPGNGRFDQLDIVSALGPGHYLTGPYHAVSPGGTSGDGQTSIGYNANTGEVFVDAPAGTELTSFNVDSAAGIFTGEPAQNLGGSFDNDADNNIFKATFGSSFGGISFGNVAPPGLSEEFVANDLTVVGSLAGGGDLGAVDLIYIPEPSGLALLGLGLAGLLAFSRRPRSG